MNKREIPLFLGEGPNREEVGFAVIEETSEGQRITDVIVTDPEKYQKIFGEIQKINPLVKELPFGIVEKHEEF